MRILLYIVVVFLTGCAPYVGYTHLSNPRVSNDGYDLVCTGLKGEYLTTGVCKNLADNSGEFVKVDLEYVWR